MGLFGKKKKKSSTPFQFRVSDSVAVPRRGYLLRLRLLNGEPALADVAPGRKLRVRGPQGGERIVVIKDYSATEGFPSQEKLDTRRELDVIVDQSDGLVDGQEIQIGWMASGPVSD
jgi:hypothetical protein